jgi:hypothetical protein
MALLLKDLLRESTERRLNVMRIQVLVEKVLTEVTESQGKKLIEMMTEVSMMVTNLNALPYTIFNAREWQFAVAATYMKIADLREEVVKISEDSKTLNCAPLIKALDEVFNQ